MDLSQSHIQNPYNQQNLTQLLDTQQTIKQILKIQEQKISIINELFSFKCKILHRHQHPNNAFNLIKANQQLLIQVIYYDDNQRKSQSFQIKIDDKYLNSIGWKVQAHELFQHLKDLQNFAINFDNYRFKNSQYNNQKDIGHENSKKNTIELQVYYDIIILKKPSRTTLKIQIPRSKQKSEIPFKAELTYYQHRNRIQKQKRIKKKQKILQFHRNMENYYLKKIKQIEKKL